MKLKSKSRSSLQSSDWPAILMTPATPSLGWSGYAPRWRPVLLGLPHGSRIDGLDYSLFEAFRISIVPGGVKLKLK